MALCCPGDPGFRGRPLDAGEAGALIAWAQKHDAWLVEEDRDLDLFGEGGLFELLCIARTRMGEDTLARWLLAPAKRDEIGARQQAVVELRARLDLREELGALGEQSTAALSPDALLSWAMAPNRLQHPSITWAVRGLAVAFVAAAAA